MCERVNPHLHMSLYMYVRDNVYIRRRTVTLSDLQQQNRGRKTKHDNLHKYHLSIVNL